MTNAQAQPIHPAHHVVETGSAQVVQSFIIDAHPPPPPLHPLDDPVPPVPPVHPDTVGVSDPVAVHP